MDQDPFFHRLTLTNTATGSANATTLELDGREIRGVKCVRLVIDADSKTARLSLDIEVVVETLDVTALLDTEPDRL